MAFCYSVPNSGSQTSVYKQMRTGPLHSRARTVAVLQQIDLIEYGQVNFRQPAKHVHCPTFREKITRKRNGVQATLHDHRTRRPNVWAEIGGRTRPSGLAVRGSNRARYVKYAFKQSASRLAPATRACGRHRATTVSEARLLVSGLQNLRHETRNT